MVIFLTVYKFLVIAQKKLRIEINSNLHYYNSSNTATKCVKSVSNRWAARVHAYVTYTPMIMLFTVKLFKFLTIVNTVSFSQLHFSLHVLKFPSKVSSLEITRHTVTMVMCKLCTSKRCRIKVSATETRRFAV
jgi:hypothetical protein